MLHYQNRLDKIYLLSLDPVLLEDIEERLGDTPGLKSIELVKPGNGRSVITADDILHLARETLTARILIVDVRSQTRAQLQRAYSDITRFNRPDFNHYCYCILVGDGPNNYFRSDRGLKTFPSYLANLRIDFSAAAFFGDPFLYYSMEEIQERAIYEQNALPEQISHHFDKYFQGGRMSVEQVRRYFRAADKEGEEKIRKRKVRQAVLRQLCIKMILDEFPDDEAKVLQALSKEGLDFPGEILRSHVYPFYFEEWVLECFKKAQAAIY